MAKVNSFSFDYPYMRIEPKRIYKDFDLDDPICCFVGPQCGYMGRVPVTFTMENRTLIVKFNVDKDTFKSWCENKEYKHISVIINRTNGNLITSDLVEYKFKIKDLTF